MNYYYLTWEERMWVGIFFSLMFMWLLTSYLNWIQYRAYKIALDYIKEETLRLESIMHFESKETRDQLAKFSKETQIWRLMDSEPIIINDE